MSTETNDDLDVVLDAAEPEKKANADIEVATEEAPKKKPALTPEIGLDELKRQLDAEKSKREQAEANARRATEDASRARSDADDSQTHLVRTAIETTKQNAVNLKAQYAEALANGDFAKTADIQEEIAKNSFAQMRLQDGLKEMEERPKQRVHDPVEAFASSLSPASAQWVRANPQFVTNPKLNQKMIAAHNMVTADDIAADTPEYFEAVEKILGLRREEQRGDDVTIENPTAEAAKAVGGRRSAPPAAPVSRQSVNNSGTRPNVVRLTAEEREMAEISGISVEDYARQKLRIQSQTH